MKLHRLTQVARLTSGHSSAAQPLDHEHHLASDWLLFDPQHSKEKLKKYTHKYEITRYEN